MTTFGTQDTGRRQTKQKPQHDDTAQKTKNTKNRDPAKNIHFVTVFSID